MTDEPAITKVRMKGATVYAMLNQGEVWFPADGRRLLIPSMDPIHRINTAKYLERRAEFFELYYSFHEMEVFGPEGQVAQDVYGEILDARCANAKEWMRETRLYRALLRGLTDEDFDRAKHWQDCPKRKDLSLRCTCGGSWKLKRPRQEIEA